MKSLVHRIFHILLDVDMFLGLPTIEKLLQRKCPICNRPFRNEDLRKLFLSMEEASYHPDLEIIEIINQIIQLRKEVIQALKKILNWNSGMLFADTLCTGAKVIGTGLALATQQYQTIGALVSGISSLASACNDIVQFAVENLNEKNFKDLVSRHDMLSADPRVAEFLRRNAIEYNKSGGCSKIMFCVNTLSLLVSTAFCMVESKRLCESRGMFDTNSQSDVDNAGDVTNENVCFNSNFSINRNCSPKSREDLRNDTSKRDDQVGRKCLSQKGIKYFTCITTLIQIGKCISKWVEYSKNKKKISEEILALENSINLMEILSRPNDETNSTEASELND